MSEKTVYNKLFKSEQVDLSSEKVELANIKDLDKAMKAADKEYAAAIKAQKQIAKVISDAKTAYRQAAIKYNEAANIGDQIETAAKELGIKLPNEIASKIFSAVDERDKATEKIKGLQAAEKSI